MHELSIASAVLDTALRHAGGRRIAAVELEVGALRQVVPGSLGFYFEIACRGTPAEGAVLDQRRVGALLRCACGAEWDPEPEPATQLAGLVMPPSFRCPACGDGGAEVMRGEELVVSSIEVYDSSPDRGRERPATAGLARPAT